ncbi:MAG: hypothetical protein J6D54_03550 [Olsenella sp.]|nr:hypothetical protein [Olsenella sp.]
MIAGIQTNNRELGLDNEKIFGVIEAVEGVFSSLDCTTIDAATVVALLQEHLTEDFGLLVVTPKVRAKLNEATFV